MVAGYVISGTVLLGLLVAGIFDARGFAVQML
jgi:hypothetical protein